LSPKSGKVEAAIKSGFTMIKVAIDVSAKIVNQAGTATYIRELTGALRQGGEAVRIEEIQYEPSFSRSRRILRKYDTARRELFWLNMALPRIVEERGCDLLHSPAMMAPRRCPVPSVVTVFDLYFLQQPGAFTRWQRRILKSLVPRSLMRADKIITISRFTKGEILKFFPAFPEERIAVTSLGVSDIFGPKTQEDIAEFKRSEGIDSPFLLSVSTIEPRKNLEGILRAFALIRDKIPHELHVIGARGWKSENLPRMVESLDIGGRVRFEDFVPIEKLALYYNSAEMLVFPSFFEGFGLPVLEAMACGCPVIASNAASLPEVAGRAAVFVDPQELGQISDAIRFLVENPAKARALTEAGYEQAKKFSWKTCAAETAAIYRGLATGK
jgi:glycosyltransferase involved in cell wall biosynthesis